MTDPVAGRPRIAVIVPCFNDGDLIEQTLSSLRDQEPVELVVVDDASTDAGTVATLRRLTASGVRVVRHERNSGLSAARMTGVAQTVAPYVFPLDADDLVAEGGLSGLADRLDDDPRLSVAFADYEEFGDRQRVVRVPDRLDPFRIAFRNEYPVASLFRRDALLAAGGWRDVAGQVGYEDWHLWMSLAEGGAQGARVGAGAVVLRRRIHGTRMLSDAGRRHRRLYADLRSLHPQLFDRLPGHRRASDLPLTAKLLYPLLYGARPPLGIRSRLLRRTRS